MTLNDINSLSNRKLPVFFGATCYFMQWDGFEQSGAEKMFFRPNAGVIALALLYGRGSYSDTINICNMCGWDTDCNVANVGCILGVAVGLEGIHRSWREPINDFLACSSVLGCMNLRDITNDAFFLASLGYRIAGEAYPEEYRAILEGSAPRFSFALPDSTHTFRVENGTASLRNIPLTDASMGRCLQGEFPAREQPVRLYRQTYYRPDDFNDDRYSPSFTPEVSPGKPWCCGCGQASPRPFAPLPMTRIPKAVSMAMRPR